MYNSKARKHAVGGFNVAVERYVITTGEFEAAVHSLYTLRERAAVEVQAVAERINALANKPREFTLSTEQAAVQIRSFEDKQNSIRNAESVAKKQAKGSAAGASLGALGIAVATMGPTAAMGVATTFGVASTGTAITSLSGAAATNAALAWLGGGTLAAGGGGMALAARSSPQPDPSAGFLRALRGWFPSASGSPAFEEEQAGRKRSGCATQGDQESVRRFDCVNAEVEALEDLTRTQVEKVSALKARVPGSDYVSFTDDEKKRAAALVNANLTLAQLINRKIDVDAGGSAAERTVAQGIAAQVSYFGVDAGGRACIQLGADPCQ